MLGALNAPPAVCLVVRVYYWILIARLLLSWFPQPPEGLRPIYDILHRLTEPPLRLVRPLIPPLRMGMMALDLSPLILFVLLYFVTVLLGC